MAIDTDTEKLSLIMYQQPYQCSAPISSDGLGQDDNQQFLWEYPGILWGAAAANVIVSSLHRIYRGIVAQTAAEIGGVLEE